MAQDNVGATTSLVNSDWQTYRERIKNLEAEKNAIQSNITATDDKADSLTAVRKKDSIIKSLRRDQWTKITDVSIYGGGSLFGLVTGDSSIEDNTSPSGSLGINFKTSRITGNLYFSYNSIQTVEMNSLSQFGQALMNPNLSGQSLTFSATARLYRYLSANGSLVIADNLWQLGEESIDASPLVIKFGGMIDPFSFSKDDLADNKINLLFGVHFTHRSILGDFANADQQIEDQTIESKGYNGIDFSVNAYLNSVHLYVQFSRNSKKDFLIPGFSGSQVTFGVNVTGNLINLKKKDKPAK